MYDVWTRIEGWLGAHHPQLLGALNSPASDAQVAAAEATLGIAFPPDVRTLYKFHDGQKAQAPWLLDGWEWLSLERMCSEWKVWKGLLDGGDFDGIQSEADGKRVRTDWWHPCWIPLSYDGAGDHDCLDLAPGPTGTVGQIIKMWHDEGSRPIVANSIRDWFAEFADDLEQGRYQLSTNSLRRIE